MVWLLYAMVMFGNTMQGAFLENGDILDGSQFMKEWESRGYVIQLMQGENSNIQ